MSDLRLAPTSTVRRSLSVGTAARCSLQCRRLFFGESIETIFTVRAAKPELLLAPPLTTVTKITRKTTNSTAWAVYRIGDAPSSSTKVCANRCSVKTFCTTVMCNCGMAQYAPSPVLIDGRCWSVNSCVGPQNTQSVDGVSNDMMRQKRPAATSRANCHYHFLH